MTLLHKNCLGFVMAQKTLKVVAPINLTSNGIVFQPTKVMEQNEEISLFCTCGKTNLTSVELVDVCMNCGEIKDLADLFHLTDAGGRYCKTCVEKYYPTSRKLSLSAIIKKSTRE